MARDDRFYAFIIAHTPRSTATHSSILRRKRDRSDCLRFAADHPALRVPFMAFMD